MAPEPLLAWGQITMVIMYGSGAPFGMGPIWNTFPYNATCSDISYLKYPIMHYYDSAFIISPCGLWHKREGLSYQPRLCDSIEYKV